ncbi:MAG: hypothetical protein Q8L11_03835 [Candidatus Moranbacteria bacterium]|nr:hypothetical protein [Candidatus Moranbacteria bacterium]
MNAFENIYGTLFLGAIAAAFFYRAYSFWSDNPAFSFFMGFAGLIFASYSIGLFLVPFLDSFRKK